MKTKQSNKSETSPNSPAVDRSVDRLVSCWSCGGTGIGAFAHADTSFSEIQCDRCQGTGQCPEKMREWEAIGGLIREDRLKSECTLRDRAHKKGWSAYDLSRAERGIIDPYSLKANAQDHRPLAGEVQP